MQVNRRIKKMSWDNIINIVAESNKIKVNGDMTYKYKDGMMIRIRGTKQSNAKHRINEVELQMVGGPTWIQLETNIQESGVMRGQVTTSQPILVGLRDKRKDLLQMIIGRVRRKRRKRIFRGWYR